MSPVVKLKLLTTRPHGLCESQECVGFPSSAGKRKTRGWETRRQSCVRRRMFLSTTTNTTNTNDNDNDYNWACRQGASCRCAAERTLPQFQCAAVDGIMPISPRPEAGAAMQAALCCATHKTFHFERATLVVHDSFFGFSKDHVQKRSAARGWGMNARNAESGKGRILPSSK